MSLSRTARKAITSSAQASSIMTSKPLLTIRGPKRASDMTDAPEPVFQDPASFAAAESAPKDPHPQKSSLSTALPSTTLSVEENTPTTLSSSPLLQSSPSKPPKVSKKRPASPADDRSTTAPEPVRKRGRGRAPKIVRFSNSNTVCTFPSNRPTSKALPKSAKRRTGRPALSSTLSRVTPETIATASPLQPDPVDQVSTLLPGSSDPNLCSERPHLFTLPSDLTIIALSPPTSPSTTTHTSHIYPCSNTFAHSLNPYMICSACRTTANRTIKALRTSHYSLLGRSAQFPLCSACAEAKRAEHSRPDGYNGCVCTKKLVEGYLCWSCRVEGLEEREARRRVEKVWRQTIVEKGADGTVMLAVGCRCGATVRKDEDSWAALCAGCEGLTYKRLG